MFNILKSSNKMLIFILLLFIVSIVCFNIVCAVNDTDTSILSGDQKDDIIQIKDNINIDDKLKETSESGCFTDLNNDIENNPSELDFTRNYTFNRSLDSNFTNGINISSSGVIIDGKGRTIDANGSAKIFIVTGDDVVLCNITFLNAYSDNGGAITWLGSDGKIINCTFINNIANQSYAGAILWSGDGGNITDCTFINNTINCTLGNDRGHGGAIAWNGSGGVINNCTFRNNNAKDGDGGAIWWSGSEGNITDCTFINNTIICNPKYENEVVRGYGYGGVIAWTGDNGVIIRSLLMNNTVKEGNGGAIWWNGTNGTIINSHFINNAINCNIDLAYKGDDVKYGFGGAIEWGGDFGLIQNCNFTVNKALDGGAIDWTGLKGVIKNSNFSFNNATVFDGGAIDVYMVLFLIDDCTFANNTAERCGGAVYWDYIGNDPVYVKYKNTESGSIINSRFINNSVVSGAGGAIDWLGPYGFLSNSIFINNTALNNTDLETNNAEAPYGGAVEWRSDYGIIGDSIFVGNSAFNSGAVDFNAHNGFIIRCNFTNNSARMLDGGAIDWAGDNGTIINCNFSINNANHDGGAINWFGNNGKVYNSNFTNNKALSSTNNQKESRGGAVYVDEGINVNITDSIFINNTATKGGALFLFGDSYLIGCILSKNNADDEGSAIYCNSYNNIINYNVLIDNEGIAIYLGEYNNCNYNWWGSNQKINNSLWLNVTIDLSSNTVQTKINMIYNDGTLSILDDGVYSKVPMRSTVYTVLGGDVKIDNGNTAQASKITFNNPLISDFNASVKVDNQVLKFNNTSPLYNSNSFSELQLLINNTNNNTLILSKNFTYDSLDKSYLFNFFGINGTGLIFNKNITIVGNGFYIDALGAMPIFNINNYNISLSDIVFKNGNIINNASTTVSSLTFYNTTIVNNNYLIINDTINFNLVNNGIVKVPYNLTVNTVDNVFALQNTLFTLNNFTPVTENPHIIFKIYDGESNVKNISASLVNGIWCANHTFDSYGNYTVSVSYLGVEANVVNSTINVTRIKPQYSINTSVVGNTIIININAVNSSAYNVTVNGIPQSVVNGVIVYTPSTVGNYTIFVSNEGNSTHLAASYNANVTYKITPVYTISVDSQVNVSDTINIIINAVNSSAYNVTVNGIPQSVVNGVVVYTPSAAGMYTIFVSSVENTTHYAANNSKIFTSYKIKPAYTISVDSQVNVGDTINIIINAVNSSAYNVTVNGIPQSVVNGVVVYTPSAAGISTIFVSNVENSTHYATNISANFTVVSKDKEKVITSIVSSGNVVVDYLKKVTYSVSVRYDDGSPAAGVKIPLTFNGKSFSAVTGSDGVARFAFNSVPGSYKVVFNDYGFSFSNDVKFNHIVSVKKTTIYKKSKKSLKIKVKVKGKKKVKAFIKIKGKKFKAKTNKKGIAHIKINKNVLNKLKKGKTYKFTAYYKKDKVTGKIKVKR